MNAGWIVPVLLLSLACALLLWRVWRLEKEVRRVDEQECTNYGVLATRIRNSDDSTLAARGSMITLARALGYEWKRTDAKEGWERTYAHVKLDNIPIGNNPAVVYHYYAKPKPDLTYTANAQGADGKVRKVSSKKPRRAH